MSEPIIVRVTLGSYDIVHPSEKQTQVYVQIPEVARASWLLPEDHFHFSKNEPWPNVVDSAQECYRQRGTVTDSASAAARAAVVEWLQDDGNHDAMQAAWFMEEARRHPVSRKLLEENERLRRQYAETVATVTRLEQKRVELERIANAERARVAELEEQREALAERLRKGQEWQPGRSPALVSQDYLSQDELRAIFGIPLVAPWDEDPCHPCGCPKRFNRHADGCPTQAAGAGDAS